MGCRQTHRAETSQRNDGLNRPFAKRIRTDNDRSLVVLQSRSNNFSTRGCAFIGQHNQRFCINCVTGTCIESLGFGRVSPAGGNDLTTSQEAICHTDR